MANPDLKVVGLHKSNFRDASKSLRIIADEIDSGKYGDVKAIAMVMRADATDVFGIGMESEPAAVALLLHVGARRMTDIVDEQDLY